MLPASGWKERLVSECQAGLCCCQLPLELQNVILVRMAEIFLDFCFLCFFFQGYILAYSQLKQRIQSNSKKA